MTGRAAGDPSAAAARLVPLAVALGEDDWAADLREVAPATPAAAPGAGAEHPSWGELALDGTHLVEALAARGRWDEASRHAAHLTDYFTANRRRLHGIAGIAFDGLRTATKARDADELGDFADLLRELFGTDGDPAGPATA
jgi:hypothetical protein